MSCRQPLIQVKSNSEPLPAICTQESVCHVQESEANTTLPKHCLMCCYSMCWSVVTLNKDR